MNWEFDKVTDYFDNRDKISIHEYAKEYDTLSYEERADVDLRIKRRIDGWFDQAEGYNKESIITAGAIIVDDIYRAGNLMYTYHDSIADYLGVTARSAMSWLSSRRITIHYMSNNTFDEFTRPLILFPRMLSRSNILYICPQYIAWQKMEDAGIPIQQFRLFYKDYRDEAYEISQDLIRRSCDAGVHYIHLDIDAGEEAFEQSFAYANTPGHIVIFREEAPQDSSQFLLLSQGVSY